MGIFPNHDGWFYYPVPLEEIVQTKECWNQLLWDRGINNRVMARLWEVIPGGLEPPTN